MTSLRDRADDYRFRAEELRSLVGVSKHEGNRELLLSCAAGYEKMADQAVQIEKRKQQRACLK